MAKKAAKKAAKARSLYSPETFRPVKVEEKTDDKLAKKRKRLKEKKR